MADDTANDASLSDNTVAGFLPDRTDAELGRDSVPGNSGDGQVKEKDGVVNWDDDPQNPYNWPAWKKTVQVVMLSSIALLATINSSIVTPAAAQFEADFHVGRTAAILPLTLAVLALGFGPIVAGPLSETVGRYPLYVAGVPLGALLAMGAGFTSNFGALLFLRFASTFCWGPVLAVAAGSLSETFRPKARGPVVAVFITMPFLGPGLGPIIGSFVAERKGWRWTQWTVVFFAVFSLILTLFSSETFHPIIKRRLAKKRGEPLPPQPPLSARLRAFANIALVRPVHMLVAEPIVLFICLYVAVEFGTLFSFFTSVPYVFGETYGFGVEDSGLVFVAILIGCVLGFVTIVLCDVLLYRPQTRRFPEHRVPPEYRLYPAIFASVGLPVGLFWFGWTARSDISWVSPVAAIIPFAWGNLCLFVTTIQYITDTYTGNVVASAASANSFARYTFGAVFPLFTIQMYERLGIAWASSLLGFIAVALLPIPWILFKFGPKIRAKSKYETYQYGDPIA